MWNQPTKKQLQALPKLYTAEEVPVKEKIIYMHFFLGGCDWFIAEASIEKNLLWGFVILNNDLEMAEWGYIQFKALCDIKINGCLEVDFDLHWKPRKASEVEKISACHF